MNNLKCKNNLNNFNFSAIPERNNLHFNSDLNSFNNILSQNSFNSDYLNNLVNHSNFEIKKESDKEKLSEFIFLKKKLTREDAAKIKRIYLNEKYEDNHNVKRNNKQKKIISKSAKNESNNNLHCKNDKIMEGKKF